MSPQRLMMPVVKVCSFTIAVFGLSLMLITLLLSLSGVDFDTALTGASTARMNVSPGLAELIGPADNFASLSDTSKWILSVGMLLGRLEFITVLVLFTPAFWRS